MRWPPLGQALQGGRPFQSHLPACAPACRVSPGLSTPVSASGPARHLARHLRTSGFVFVQEGARAGRAPAPPAPAEEPEVSHSVHAAVALSVPGPPTLAPHNRLHPREERLPPAGLRAEVRGDRRCVRCGAHRLAAAGRSLTADACGPRARLPLPAGPRGRPTERGEQPQLTGGSRPGGGVRSHESQDRGRGAGCCPDLLRVRPSGRQAPPWLPRPSRADVRRGWAPPSLTRGHGCGLPVGRRAALG